MSALSRVDQRSAFKRATSSLMSWYGEEVANGVSDERLAELLGNALGIAGGSSGGGEIKAS